MDCGLWILDFGFWLFGSSDRGSQRRPGKFTFSLLCTDVTQSLMRDGSVMADSDLVDFLSGPTDSAINFNGSADLHTPIHPPPNQNNFGSFKLTSPFLEAFV